MRAVIQKVKKAAVEVEGRTTGEIGRGLMILLGIEEEDSKEDIDWLVKKVVNMRIFEDEEGKMNRDVKSVDGGILAISQFTLHASTKKGNRPSFIRAAKPDTAVPLYNQFNETCSDALGKPVQTGEFGAQMDVNLINKGPVTIILDSKEKE